MCEENAEDHSQFENPIECKQHISVKYKYIE